MEVQDLNDIRIFVVIAQAGTLTAAAQSLNLPTSTVSRSLTRLEKQLDVFLVQRSSRGTSLTDIGREYLNACRRAMRTLKDGGDLLNSRRQQPSGLIKIGCPITMARSIFGPLLREFLQRYPGLRVEIDPYCSGWDQEPREDVDVFFKVRAPRDSVRRVRSYPGTKRGMFANPQYIAAHGLPTSPEELLGHACIGSGTWKLTKGSAIAAPNIAFTVVTSDPVLHLELALSGLGIAILPLFMGKWPATRDQLIPVLPRWIPEPITLCALFSGAARLTPKVQVLLDFLAEYIGTDRDPRLQKAPSKGLFTEANLVATSGP